MVNAGLYIAYALIAVATLATLIFPLLYTAQNFGDAKKSLMGVGALLLVVVVAYVLSSGEFYFKGIEKFELSENQIKIVSTGLNSFYILVVLAILSTVYSEVSSIFK